MADGRRGAGASRRARSRRFGARCSSSRGRSSGSSPSDGPADPEPELVVEDGVVTRLDGRAAADFDVIDRFLVAHGLDLDVAVEAMALPDERLARMLVDVDVPRDELVRLARGLTPAKLARVVGMLDPVELMMALKKLRARRDPGNQAHVTNLKESPALLAADAAEAARRGFDELETTVGVARYAPLNALALLVGSQTGRPGVMTQCAVEERRNLELAIRGLVTYAETLSVYGTERVFADGDDTPWSKAFLASAYASRGVKVRFTSGTGSEALMGHAEGLSMLYLEARCVSVVRAAGAQGVQNGSISCVALVLSVPGGTRAILAENVLAAWLDLEVASGNDAIASHSAIRKTAKLMGQFLPGTDFVTSGYSVMPRSDNTFGGGNYDADDIDEWLTIQRDWQVDGGIEPVAEDEVLRVRERARAPCRRVFAELGLPAGDGRRGRGGDSSAIRAGTCPTATARPTSRRPTSCSSAASRHSTSRSRSTGAASRTSPRRSSGMLRQRVAADYLQTSAVIEPDGLVRSAVNDPERVPRAGDGLPPRGRALGAPPGASARRRSALARRRGDGRRRALLEEDGAAPAGDDPAEVVVAVGPAFADGVRETINGLPHADVLARDRRRGARRPEAAPRVVRVRRSADVAFIGHDGALTLRLGRGARDPVEGDGGRSTAPTSSRSTTSSCSG